jgi:hypothetical protein
MARPETPRFLIRLVLSFLQQMASMQENKVNLVGSWRTEVGALLGLVFSLLGMVLSRFALVLSLYRSSYCGWC